MSKTLELDELKRLADQFICHPVSRSPGEIEQAGEAITDLLARLDAVEKELEAIRALEPVAEVIWYEPDPDQKDQRPGKIIDASHAFFDRYPIGTKLYTAPPKAQPMSDEQIHNAWYARDCIAAIQAGDLMAQIVTIVRAVERHHGIGE